MPKRLRGQLYPPGSFTHRFGAAVRRAREETGLSQKAASEQLGLSRGAFNRIESAQNSCSLETAARIAAFLGSTVSELAEERYAAAS